jgi:hypothetical protein
MEHGHQLEERGGWVGGWGGLRPTQAHTYKSLRARRHGGLQRCPHGHQVAVCGRIAGATTGCTRAVGIILAATATPNTEATKLGPAPASKASPAHNHMRPKSPNAHRYRHIL